MCEDNCFYAIRQFLDSHRLTKKNEKLSLSLSLVIFVGNQTVLLCLVLKNFRYGNNRNQKQLTTQDASCKQKLNEQVTKPGDDQGCNPFSFFLAGKRHTKDSVNMKEKT